MSLGQLGSGVERKNAKMVNFINIKKNNLFCISVVFYHTHNVSMGQTAVT